jgi:hypothetical protein
VILFRCAQGLVAYDTHVTNRRIPQVQVRCLNDGAKFLIPFGPPGARLLVLENMAAHAVQLKGAIGQLVEVSFGLSI